MSSTPSTRRARSAGCGRTRCRTTSSGRSSTPRSAGRRAATTSTGAGSWSPTTRSRTRSPRGTWRRGTRCTAAGGCGCGRSPTESRARAIARRRRLAEARKDPNYRAGEHLAANIGRAPVWVFAIVEDVEGTPTVVHGANIFGAVQNLMLAARAHGLGSTLTMLHRQHETEVAALLGLPGRRPGAGTGPDRLPGVRPLLPHPAAAGRERRVLGPLGRRGTRPTRARSHDAVGAGVVR